MYTSIFSNVPILHTARAVGAKSILNSQGRKRRSTVLEQILSVIRSAKIRIAVNARVVIEERDRRLQESSLLVSVSTCLKLFERLISAIILFLLVKNSHEQHTSVIQTWRPPPSEQILLTQFSKSASSVQSLYQWMGMKSMWQSLQACKNWLIQL